MKPITLLPAVQKIAERLAAAGAECYLVGGALRDHFLGKEVNDYDLATSARPEEVMALFPKVIPSGIKHGTVTIMFGKNGYEITTLREDANYNDGRHPERVTFVRNIYTDLARRDFTINAMAYKLPQGELFYPYGGSADLAAGCIRTVGVAEKRFNEDALRILRAARFSAKLNFNIAADTMAAMKKLANLLNLLSKERISHEFCQLITAPHAGRGLLVLQELDIISFLWPELRMLNNWSNVAANIEKLPAILTTRLTYLLSFLPSWPQKMVDSLVLPKAVSKRVFTLWQLLKEKPPQGATYERAFIATYYPFLEEYMELAGLKESQLAKRYLEEPVYRDKDLAIKSSELMELCQIKAGPLLGQLRHFLLQKVWENPLVNKREVLLNMAQKWQEEIANGH